MKKQLKDSLKLSDNNLSSVAGGAGGDMDGDSAVLTLAVAVGAANLAWSVGTGIRNAIGNTINNVTGRR